MCQLCANDTQGQDGVAQMRRRKVRVPHHHGQAGVSKQICHRPQTHPALHQVAGKRVPTVVWHEVLNARGRKRLLPVPIETTPLPLLAINLEDEVVAARFQPVKRGMDRDRAVTPRLHLALACADPHGILRNVCSTQRKRLAQPHPRQKQKRRQSSYLFGACGNERIALALR